MNRKEEKMTQIVISAVIIAMAFWYCKISRNKDEFLQPIHEEIRNCCRLATQRLEFSNKADIQKTGRIIRREHKLWIRHQIAVTIGIDLEKLVIDDASRTVWLPPAEILTVSKADSLKEIRSKSLLRKFSTMEKSKALAKAMQDVVERLDGYPDLFRNARLSAKMVLEMYLSALNEEAQLKDQPEWKVQMLDEKAMRKEEKQC